MSRKILALHGQPGDGDDFSALVKSFKKFDINLVPVQQIQDVDKIIEADSFDGIIAYSMGAYSLIRLCCKYPQKIKNIFLIAPYLIPTNTVSAVTEVITNLPVIGKWILKNYAQKNTHQFLEKTFQPQVIPDTEVIRKMQDRLQTQWSLWQAAIQEKIKMQNNPIEESTLGHLSVNGVVFLAEKDQAADMHLNKNIIQKINSLQIEEITNAGHGILWTHADFISERIAKFYESKK